MGIVETLKRRTVKSVNRAEKEKARSNTTWPRWQSQPQETTGRRTYLAYFGAGVITSSFFCAQAPKLKALAKTATIMIAFKNFNLSRLLSEQVAALF
jgi:hypothetical protein